MKIEHKNQNHEGNNPNLRDVNRVASVRKKVRKKGKKNKKEMRLNRTELKEKNKKRLGTEVRVNHPVTSCPSENTNFRQTTTPKKMTGKYRKHL
jgi:hypothetical protein